MADNSPQQTSEVKISLRADALRADVVRGLFWFVNYAAIDPEAISSDQLDLHGAAMLPEDVELFAHRWLAHSRVVDIQHDGIGRPIHVIESFVNSPEIASPSWPLNSHAVRLDVHGSKEAFDGLKSGSLNSISLDAFTFNQVRRLPARPAVSAKSIASGDADVTAWVESLARLGFDGVTGVSRVGDMYVVTRSSGLPLGVEVTADSIEVTPSGGVWANVAARLVSGATLTAQRLAAPTPGPALGDVPSHGETRFGVDYHPWPQNLVDDMLSGVGIGMDLSDLQPLSGPQSPWLFVRADGAGELAHHTFRSGKMMVSRDGVMEAMSRLSSLPEAVRPAARAHLASHIETELS